MKIAVIGAGNIGGNLTRRFTAVGHEVTVANSRGPETLTELTSETGAHAARVEDAAKGAELVVVTIPEKKVPDLPKGVLDDAAEGAVIIDTGNYYPNERDGRIDAIEDGTPESVWVSGLLGRPVIKVFNGIYAQKLLDRPQPTGTPGRLALPVAGDDAAAKQKVVALLDEIGFDAVDAGSLSDSWRQQPDSPVYGLDGDVEAVTAALAKASPERPAAFSAA